MSILHKLKPTTFTSNDLIYQQGEAPTDIYFIQTGVVTLYSDLNDHITDQELLTSMAKKQDGGIMKASISAIIQYTEGGYFGDSDILARRKDMPYLGRDLTAICVADDSIMFQMNLSIIQKIKDQFSEVYKQMK